MNTKCFVTLALAAGFIGGLTSRYCGPTPVYAQSPASPPEIRAQKFVLVDENGVAREVFGIEKNGAPEIEITDSKGRVFATVFADWSVQHGILADSFVPGPKKPTLLPIKP
jgi:hypothetical protein